MESKWQRVRLGDVLKITHGWPFKSERFTEERAGRPIVVNIGNFQYTGGFRFESTTVKEYTADYPKDYELSPRDILLVMTCQTSGGEILGIPGRIPDDGNTYLHNQRMGKVVIKEPKRVDSDFIYYLALWSDFNRELYISASGTKILHTAPVRIEAFEFNLPPLAEQKAIAAVLGALDEKIELNRRINTTLEAMARALFQSWFVDFDPVRAKLDGRQPPGLDTATAALFPNEFEESALGSIPKGWKAGAVVEEFNLTMGQSPPGTTYNEEGRGIPLYQGKTDFGFRFPTRRIFCTAPTRYAKPSDTLVSVRAPVGDINMAKEECCVGRGVAAVRHKTGATSFTYYSMSNLYPDFARFEAEGTVFGSINKDSFEKLPFVIAPPEIVAAYERQACPLDEQIRILENQSHTLATLRDALLPKLMSGELGSEGASSLAYA